MSTQAEASASASTFPVSILDYGAGNIVSLQNSLVSCGYSDLSFISTPQQIRDAKVIIFPGVGAFGSAMEKLNGMPGVVDALKQYIQEERPYFGICLGMQVCKKRSEERKKIVLLCVCACVFVVVLLFCRFAVLCDALTLTQQRREN